jgi:5-methylcytosine-specific restriction endonuclease McrA
MMSPQERLPDRTVRVPRRSIPDTLKIEVLKKHKFQCHYCKVGLQFQSAHLDHALPRGRGGVTAIYNLRACCVSCNIEKGGRTEVEYLVWKVLNYRIDPFR